MKTKKWVVGIKFPDGKTKTLMLFIPSKDGYILTVPHSNAHVTILDKGGTISSHVTDQKTDRHKHLGELSKSDEYDDVIERAFKLRKLNEDELDTQVFYWTKQGIDLLNEPQLIWVEEKSKDQIFNYLDLSSTISRAGDTAVELSKSPESFFGLCRARDLLSNSEIEVGISNMQEKLGIMEINSVLYEIDLSSFLDIETDSPLYEILEPLGVPILFKDIQKRFQDIVEEPSDSSKY